MMMRLKRDGHVCWFLMLESESVSWPRDEMMNAILIGLKALK